MCVCIAKSKVDWLDLTLATACIATSFGFHHLDKNQSKWRARHLELASSRVLDQSNFFACFLPISIIRHLFPSLLVSLPVINRCWGACCEANLYSSFVVSLLPASQPASCQLVHKRRQAAETWHIDRSIDRARALEIHYRAESSAIFARRADWV